MHDDSPWTDHSVSPAQALLELRAWLEQMKSVPRTSQHTWIEQHVADIDDREALYCLLESDEEGLDGCFERSKAL